MKQLTLRERVLVLNLVLAVVWAGYFLLRYRRGRAEVDQLERQAAALEKQKTKLTADLAALQRQDAGSQDAAALQRELRQLEQKLARAQETLAQWRKALDASARVGQVQQLKLRFAQAAREAGLQLVGWSPWKPSRTAARLAPGMQPRQSASPPGRGKGKRGPKTSTTEPEPLPQWCRSQGCHLYRVRLRGSYAGVVRLLRRLETFPPQVVTLEVSLTPQQKQARTSVSALEVELLVCL